MQLQEVVATKFSYNKTMPANKTKPIPESFVLSHILASAEEQRGHVVTRDFFKFCPQLTTALPHNSGRIQIGAKSK